MDQFRFLGQNKFTGLAPVDNFTNILQAAFAPISNVSKNYKAKMEWESSIFFALLGSALEKTVSKMLVKLTPVLNFINFLWAAFMHADPKNVKKDSQVVSLFLRFRDLRLQKLFLKCWWNWHLDGVPPPQMIGFPWKSSSIPGLFVTTGKSGNFSQISFPVAESRSISSTESVSPRDVCPSATNIFVKPKKCMLWKFSFYCLLKTWPKYGPWTDICGPLS